ncbi:MAG TPA: cytochrome c maturation protein CcmE [Acidimicrobiales bacterium]|nr:cytochrome c maturation protein CcmE [Acidimicrobiales bacterium]
MDVTGPAGGDGAGAAPGTGGDAGPELDLSPRTGPDGGAGRPRSRSRAVVGGLVIAALLGAIGFVAVRQLQGSSVYYYNADEAVAERPEIGDRRVRVQGTVVGQPVEVDDETVTFTIAFRGASIDVRHQGAEPPPLFDANVPSVVEGRFAPDGTFLSDRIVIKHSEQYKEENSDRVDPAAP